MAVSNPAARSLPASIAYFSMEVGIDPRMPTYSGGLGILAGDTLRAAADVGVPQVGVTLLHRKGYFRQGLDAHGNQTERPYEWSPESILEPLEPRVSVTIEGRSVRIRAWRYVVHGLSGHVVPIYFLDTALPENSPADRALTDYLYGGDERYRLCQEVVLGFGGVLMLRALGHAAISTFHMNEGHSALLSLALLNEVTNGNGLRQATPEVREAIRQKCIFTTHTPVPAGHDDFAFDLVRPVLGQELTSQLMGSECCASGTLNMTYLGLYFSRYVNGVAMRHGKISRDMYPGYPINSIDNGVHAMTWAADSFQSLYDQYIPEWRNDNLYLRYAISIPLGEVRRAHAAAKQKLIAEVARRAGVQLDPNAMTLGFARRATAYKRAELLLSDHERLKRIARQVGPLQVVYGGKAHPRDEGGKGQIRRIFKDMAALKDYVRIVYLEEYDMVLARSICSGVDLWVNTPQKPQEASGTSGMKAALNGVPSFSVLDGWWVEGRVEGVTGWAIGDSSEVSHPEQEADSMYQKLETVIMPMFYKRPDDYAEVMRSAIAINGSFFNTQRMVAQYVKNAYRMALETGVGTEVACLHDILKPSPATHPQS